MTGTTAKKAVGRRPRVKGIDPATNTREDVLSAARRIFALKGYSGTSVREVADAARVNKAMIYYYFDDKRDLYRAVLSGSFDTLQRVWDNSVFKSDASSREKIETYIEGFVRFQHRNEDLRRILTMEYSTTGAKSENIKWIARRYFAKNHASLVKILKQGMRAGELRKTDPLMAVVVLIGMIIHSFIFEPMSPHVQGKKINITVSKLSAFVAGMFFDGIGVPEYARKRA
jgi:TetR/AcrR family transcriptional regulator